MKYIECIIGSGFIGSSVYTMVNYKNKKVFKNFEKLLDNDQKKLYNKIKKERLKIYRTGLIFSIVISIIAVQFLNISTNNKINTFVVLSSGLNYLYYTLYPKSTYILLKLNTKEQKQAWLDIYLEMKQRSIYGFLLGVIGNLFLGIGICKN